MTVSGRRMALASVIALIMASAVACSPRAAHAVTDAEIRALTDRVGREFVVAGVSDDPTYGFSDRNPMKVGGVNPEDPERGYSELPLRKELMQILLVTSRGETMRWSRVGSCCPFRTEKDPLGGEALLDMYLVQAPGRRAVRLFVNHYDAGALLAPMGFGYHRTLAERQQYRKAQESFGQPPFEDGIEAFKPLAKQGMPLAAYYLGHAYLSANRPGEALVWFRKAAERGLAHGQLSYALSLNAAKFGAPNPKLSMQWLRKAAANREPEARARLADALATGAHGLEPDRNAAIHWWYLSAHQGMIRSQVAYGMALMNGEGVRRNRWQGLKWLALAAKADDPDGVRLFEEHVARMGDDARGWVEQAVAAWISKPAPSELVYETWRKARDGDAQARFDYAIMLFNGALTDRKPVDATFQFGLAARQGHEQAETVFKRTMASLTPDERAEVTQRLETAR